MRHTKHKKAPTPDNAHSKYFVRQNKMPNTTKVQMQCTQSRWSRDTPWRQQTWEQQSLLVNAKRRTKHTTKKKTKVQFPKRTHRLNEGQLVYPCHIKSPSKDLYRLIRAQSKTPIFTSRDLHHQQHGTTHSRVQKKTLKREADTPITSPLSLLKNNPFIVRYCRLQVTQIQVTSVICASAA